VLVKLTINNSTDSLIRVYVRVAVSGVTSNRVVSLAVPAGASQTIQLAAGRYDMAAEVPGSPSVLPFYGQVTIAAGASYQETISMRL
jgi:hypothetical protein